MSSSSKMKPGSAKKGPGKPREHLKGSSSKTKGGEGGGAEPPAPKELSFPLLKTVDNDRMLPRYSAVLHRTDDDGVGMEDLDALQLELEALLSAVVVRSRALTDEIQILSSAEEKREKKSVKLGPVSPGGKRSKHHDKPAKKLKDSYGKAKESAHSPLSIKITKLKGVQGLAVSPAHTVPLPEPHALSDPSKLEAPRMLLPKNDTPNKFWLSVEPYCADILPEDVKLLDELIQEHDQDAEYQKVPPLGRHYSLRWAQEDLLEEQEAASSQAKGSKGRQPDLALPPRPGDASGPLTQRLVTCFMEENVMVPTFDRARVRGGENTTPPRANSFRNHTVGHATSVERRIKKELEDQGLLDSNDSEIVDADDEILAEMKRCQAELRVVAAHNLQQLQKLRRLAASEMCRQELKRRLQQVEGDILDVYRRIQACKLKKQAVSRRDQELALEAVRERRALLAQVDKL
ncbi:transcriptional adapter 3-B isoform X2 [Bacillus rossius redtenbacheri]